MNPNPTNISQQDFEFIDRFLNNELDKNELIEFKKRLQSDTLFKHYFEEQQLFTEAIEELALTNKLNNFHEQATSKVISINNNSSSRFRKLSIAASIAIILGLGGFWMFNRSTSNEKIFATYFIPDPGLPTTMGTTNEFTFYDGMVNYKRKEYDLALKKWEGLLVHKKDNDTLNYFIGVTYLNQGKMEEALPYLKKVSEQKESLFLEDSYYYLGLSNLKSDNEELAIAYFKKSNRPEAQQILKALQEK